MWWFFLVVYNCFTWRCCMLCLQGEEEEERHGLQAAFSLQYSYLTQCYVAETRRARDYCCWGPPSSTAAAAAAAAAAAWMLEIYCKRWNFHSLLSPHTHIERESTHTHSLTHTHTALSSLDQYGDSVAKNKTGWQRVRWERIRVGLGMRKIWGVISGKGWRKYG